ncbi:MAG: hypothetical protein AAFR98_05350 [Pseudomonadota bacterium]
MTFRYLIAAGIAVCLSACASVDLNIDNSSAASSTSGASASSNSSGNNNSAANSGLDFGAESALPPALDAPLGPGNWLAGNAISRALVGPAFGYSAQIRGNDLSGLIRFKRGGEIAIQPDGGLEDWGRWRIVENNACLRLAVGFGGQEVCMAVRDDGRGRFATSVGFNLLRL